MKLGEPFVINVHESGMPLSDVLTYADDVYKGKTDVDGNIVVLLKKDIKSFYHQGHRTELLLMVGYDNKEKRQLISDGMQHMLTYPFTQAGFDLGYYMVFMTEEEYTEVNNSWMPEDPVKRPMSSLSLFKEKYELPVNIHGFLTLFDPICNLSGGSQVAIRFSVNMAIEEIYNRPNSHRYHQKCFGLLAHELGHDSVEMWHDEKYSILPYHGGGYDMNGMTAYPCIMCTNSTFFCPRCRLKLRAVEPNVHCFATEEEKQDIIKHHLYWYEKDRLENVGEYACGQIHQPQFQTENVKGP